MAGVNPQVAQGVLNRVRTHVVVANFPTLSTTASQMGKAMAVMTFDGPGVDQIETAVGLVSSPKPFVMGQIVLAVLRTQPVAQAWISQWQTAGILGQVTTYPDTSMLNGIVMVDTVISDIDPGPFDGTNPEMKVTLRGAFQINNVMWSLGGS